VKSSQLRTFHKRGILSLFAKKFSAENFLADPVAILVYPSLKALARKLALGGCPMPDWHAEYLGFGWKAVNSALEGGGRKHRNW
jgi:hypothetical protein